MPFLLSKRRKRSKSFRLPTDKEVMEQANIFAVSVLLESDELLTGLRGEVFLARVAWDVYELEADIRSFICRIHMMDLRVKHKLRLRVTDRELLNGLTDHLLVALSQLRLLMSGVNRNTSTIEIGLL